jgi:prepilin-type N-terminal cleavage/methylation domain-containing protein
MTSERSTGGFTLIELLVVVVMVGILAAIAAPGWLTFITNQRLNTVQDEMLQVFRSAQSNARRTNRDYAVTIDSTNAVLTVAPGSSNELGAEQIRDKLVLEGEDSDGDAVTTITFDTKGQIVGVDLPIVLSVSLDGLNSNPQCLVFTTLLGNMVTAEGDACNSPDYAP